MVDARVSGSVARLNIPMKVRDFLGEAIEYSDFVTTPIAMLVTLTAIHFSIPALIAIGGGFVGWTSIEYWVHRAMHIYRPLVAYHIKHHQHPTDASGLAIYAGLIGAGLTCLALHAPALAPAILGLLAGYLAFVVVHHLVHQIEMGGALAENHDLHHHKGFYRMYGVVTPFWDHVFDTD